MTVKELKEILDACNDDAVIIVTCSDGASGIVDDQVFHTTDNQVIIDTTFTGDDND